MAVVVGNERLRKLLRTYPIEALELLYDLHYKNLLRLALKLTHDENAAKDIVHDAFLLIWEQRNNLSGHHEKSIEFYLGRIVRNRAVSFFNRRKHISIEDLLLIKGLLRDEHPMEENYIQADLRSEMRRYILTFPKREQQCLLMKIDREMSLDHIATELGVSRKMVEKSQTSALKRLKKWASSG